MSIVRSLWSSLRGKGPDLPLHEETPTQKAALPEKYGYTRPDFLQLPATDVFDHDIRPIFVSGRSLPLNAGYAECINGGKSKVNEDQAAVGSFYLCIGDNTDKAQRIPVTYYGIFDGHGGPGAALMAADVLIVHIQEKLNEITDDLLNVLKGVKDDMYFQEVTVDDLVFGALEAAFCSLDEQILKELSTFHISGGCAALVLLVLLGKVFVANAGDCRAVACLGDKQMQLCKECTPWGEIHRLQQVAKSSACSSMFQENVTSTIFIRRVLHRDLGKKVLCKEPTKSHWSYKVVTENDLLFPFIFGKGKHCRLLETIGVSRSLGDHNVTTTFTRDYKLKPFLIPNPEVSVLNLHDVSVTSEDFIIVGCDGLWDVLSNKKACDIVRKAISTSTEQNRFVAAAQILVHQARGTNSGSGWKLENGHTASFDDISVFVIPLEPPTHSAHNPVEK